MVSKPMIYSCCLPRSGITAICFIHGCIGYLSFVVFLLVYLFNSTILGPESKHTESLYFKFECTRVLLSLTISTVYFYASYMSYKKNVLLINSFVKIFISSITLNTVIALYGFYELIEFAKNMNTVYEEEEIKEEPSFQIKLIVMACYTGFYILFFILPLLNEVYFVRKLRQYIEYIEIKKNDIKQSI